MNALPKSAVFRNNGRVYLVTKFLKQSNPSSQVLVVGWEGK